MNDLPDEQNTAQSGPLPLPCCATCKKTPPEVTLKRCAKCSVTSYCSRDCQKTDWKTHKKACGKQQQNAADTGPSTPRADGRSFSSPPKGLDSPIDKPFTRLDEGTWLHGRSEKDVFRLLVDAYRLHLEDDLNFDGRCDDDSIYGGATNSLESFRRFLRTAAARKGLLPAWWNADKQGECERFGMTTTEFSNLRRKAGKSELISHYGHPQFPMQLRMFTESVLGRGPGGMNGTSMRKSMMAIESGEIEGHVTHLDIS
ncbi:Tudor domain-containing protein 1 [Pleurostoma richardsiae]|uniref:Tudor domain-containing protein 1 n=1 Tax=Pleurostoma richardsiae TaxID=41990 RepID=A0AA38S286_9PEZI|nr:Tudor domain-containing protein 1 [Pleurostoma richardsiae]